MYFSRWLSLLPERRKSGPRVNDELKGIKYMYVDSEAGVRTACLVHRNPERFALGERLGLEPDMVIIKRLALPSPSSGSR